MSRYYDSDEERLPEGMTRVGYDADTQVYTFRDQDGSLWEGPPGSRYGHLTRVSGPSPSQPPQQQQPQAPLQRRPWRQEYMPLLNFFLLIGVFLLGVFWFMGFTIQPSTPPPACGHRPSHTVEPGDTCWDIAKGNGISLDELRGANEGLDCDRLSVGSIVCLPRNT